MRAIHVRLSVRINPTTVARFDLAFDFHVVHLLCKLIMYVPLTEQRIESTKSIDIEFASIVPIVNQCELAAIWGE